MAGLLEGPARLAVPGPSWTSFPGRNLLRMPRDRSPQCCFRVSVWCCSPITLYLRQYFKPDPCVEEETVSRY